jgi:hypothetical protein
MRSFLIVVFLVVISFEKIYAQNGASGFYEKYRDKELRKNDLSASEFQSLLKKYNFSDIFTCTDNSAVYGFIGDNFQRIHIKFIKVSKSKTVTGVYDIYGKSMVKNNIDDFHGILSITKIRIYKNICLGVDNMYKDSGIKAEGRLIGTYQFSENTQQNHSGIFKGTFQSDFFIDKNNKICYDSLSMVSDSFTNNRFVGTWTSYDGNLIKKCNWGDYRIPNSGDFDIGAGDFSPDTSNPELGWQTYQDQFLTDITNLPLKHSRRGKLKKTSGGNKSSRFF